MALVVIRHHREPRIVLGRIVLMEHAEQVPKQCVGFAWPRAVVLRAGRQIECARHLMPLMPTPAHGGQLHAFRHPHTTNLGQQVDIEFVRHHQCPPRPQLAVHPEDPGQTLHVVWIFAFANELGALPHPADLVEPAPHRVGRDGDAPCGLQPRAGGLRGPGHTRCSAALVAFTALEAGVMAQAEISQVLPNLFIPNGSLARLTFIYTARAPARSISPGAKPRGRGDTR
jgi:hypothetical protein